MNEMFADQGPPADDVRLYVAHMERIKLRIEETRRLLHKIRPDERDTLYAALQLRIAIEETACASLIANRTAFEDAERAFRLKKFKEVQKALASINSAYWPEAVEEWEPDPKTGRPTKWEPVAGALTGAEWLKNWGELSELLHMRNPWFDARNIGADHRFVKQVMSNLVNTLNAHVTKLAGGKHLIMAQVGHSPVRAYTFRQISNE